MRTAFSAAVLLLAGMGSAQAQTAPEAAPVAAPVDPARLAAAQQLLAVMMPPDQRDKLVESMIRPMMANIRQSIRQTPAFADMFDSDTTLGPAFENFLKGQEDRAIETIRSGMPGMMDAMARAYARTFDAGQLADIRTFFETPTGRLYMGRMSAIMSDPDVQAWQRELVTRSMTHMQEDIGKFAADIAASHSSQKK